ncbi:MAG: hypothetical protein WAN65_27730 [Candidatus Sulfotelmatobacter sp.]
MSLFGTRRSTRETGFALLPGLIVTMSFSLAACSRHNAPPPPDASALLQNIAAPDPEKYPTLQENKHWGNPYLVIRVDAIGLLSGAAANEEQMLKPEEVLPALAHLPASAWPYGRVVAILVQEKATASEQEKIALRRSRGIVAGELESAHVAIHWIAAS